MSSNLEESSLDTEINTPKTLEIEKLFGKACEIKQIHNGDLIPIGGNVLNDELTTRVKADFDNLDAIIQSMSVRVEKYNLKGLKEWVESSQIDINEELFAKLYAFTEILGKTYPLKQNPSGNRDIIYGQNKSGEVKLSEIFNSGVAECAEIAALAQYYLQKQQVTSSFINGEVLWKRDGEFGEPHSFIRIKTPKISYIFDPANPTKTTQGDFPSIYTTEVNFDEAIREGKKKYVTSKNIITNDEAYFGVGNGTDVSQINIV